MMKRIRTRCFLQKVRGILCLALMLVLLVSTVSSAWGMENDDQLLDGTTASSDSPITEDATGDAETAAVETSTNDNALLEEETAEEVETPSDGDTTAETETPSDGDTTAETETTAGGHFSIIRVETGGNTRSITYNMTVYSTLQAAVNAAANGDIIYVDADYNMTGEAGGSVTISGKTVTISSLSAPVTLTAATDIRHITIQSGGGLILSNIILNGDGSTSGTANTIAGGDGKGGGVYVNGGSLAMNADAVIEYCKADKGGGVYVDNGGSLAMNNDSIIQYCYARYTSSATGDGGGVYVSGGTLTMIGNAAIQLCLADSFGGGVCFEGNGGVMTMDDSSLLQQNETYCPSTMYSDVSRGGGIYLGKNATLTMKNTAQVIENKAASSSATAACYGGGIYVAPVACEVTMEGNSLVKGNSSDGGGGVYAGGKFTMSENAEITDCTSSTAGGGVSTGNNSIVELNGSSGIHDNTAITGGGGIYMGGGMLTMNSGNIYKNKAMNGGGICVDRDSNSDKGGTFYMRDGMIDSNEASFYGGGVFITGGSLGDSIYLMTGGTVSNNFATIRGGGVYLTGYAQFTLNEDDHPSNITNNGIKESNKTTYGGGVYVNRDSIFEMSAGVIDKNKASDNGGGVYLNQGSASFTMSGGTIGGSGNANTVGIHGGGVYTSLGIVTMSGSAEITYNEAANSGGGVYIGNAAWKMSDGSISNNTANVNGGGVYINDGKFSMSNGVITDNSANRDGGGIYTTVNGTVDVENAAISGNTAAKDGGGIYTAAADYVTANGIYAKLTVASTVTFGGNTANKAYIPLDATKAPYDSYWPTITNSSASTGVTTPVSASRLNVVNNYDINASLVLVKFDPTGGDYYVSGSAQTISDQSHPWSALVTNPESIANSMMYQKDYKFMGWTLKGSSTIWNFSSNLTDSVADDGDGTSDGVIHLYAKWEEIEGSIRIEKFRDDGSTGLDGVEFTLTDASGNIVGTPQETKNGGIVEFKNLPVGEYVITETKAPQGYSLLGGSFDAKIPTDVTTGSYTGATKQTTPDGKIYGYDLTYEITNQASFKLPDAGDTGRWNQDSLWIGLGLLLAGGGSAAWWLKRRGLRRAA